MLDLEQLKKNPAGATPDQILELIRELELLREFSRAAGPAYSSDQDTVDDGAIGAIKSMPR
jgi:hypothetical protein